MLNLQYLHDIRRWEIEALLPLFPPNSSILEVGGGSGLQALVLSEHGRNIRSIDVATSRYNVDKIFPVAEYDGRVFPFPDAAFDVVYTSNVLEHVPDLKRFHAEVRRVLRPGGLHLHVVPSAVWKFWSMVSYYATMPREICRRLRRVYEKQRCLGRSRPLSLSCALAGNLYYTLRHPIAERHGDRGNSLTELYHFSRRGWEHHFQAQGLRIQRQGQVGLFYSGYMWLGGRMGLAARARLSRILGSACLWFIVSPENETPVTHESLAA